MAYTLRFHVPVDIPAATDRHGGDISGDEILAALRRQMADWERSPSRFKEELERLRGLSCLNDEAQAWVLHDPATGKVVSVVGSGREMEDLALIRASGDIGKAAVDWKKAACIHPGDLVWCEIEDLGSSVPARLISAAGEMRIDLLPILRNASDSDILTILHNEAVPAEQILRALVAELNPVGVRALVCGLGPMSPVASSRAIEDFSFGQSPGQKEEITLIVDQSPLRDWVEKHRPHLLDDSPEP